MSKLLFSTFDVTRQSFFRTTQSFAIVNLKPVVPGHILVVPTRVVPRLSDLEPAEMGALFTTVRHVGTVIERVYEADGLTVVCQDGKAAGQTVPHVHVHILPRMFKGDPFAEQNDAIYSAIEREAKKGLAMASEAESADIASIARDSTATTTRVDAEDERKPRTAEEMEEEATWLRAFFEPA